MADAADTASTGDIQPPVAPAVIIPALANPSPEPGRANVLAVAARLARTQPVPDALLAALAGPLGAAVAQAADYAGDSLAPATRRAYARDWHDFAAWCRAQGADPTLLPIHPVLVAAYLASLVPGLARSALNGRVILEPTDWPAWLAETADDAAALLRPAADDVLRM